MTNRVVKKHMLKLAGYALIFSAALMSLAPPAHAVRPLASKEAANMNIRIGGFVQVAEECEFAVDDEELFIDFHDIFIDQINDGEYKKRVDYKFKCPPDAPQDSIALSITGDPVDWDPTLYASLMDGIAVRVTDDGKMIKPGDTMRVAPDGSSDVEVELVKKEGARLSAGSTFYAALVLTIFKD